ncbi:putative AAA+ ATPase domain, ATPase, AAA-type, core, Vps4 oligomerization [Plasmopara halstedii]
MAHDDSGRVMYELLRTHGDLNDAETHKEILKALSSIRADRQSVDVLEQLHATSFTLLRCRESRKDGSQVSKRRNRVRNEWRQRKIHKGATLKDVQRRYPKLFEGQTNEDHQDFTSAVKFGIQASQGKDVVRAAPSPPLLQHATRAHVPARMKATTIRSADLNNDARIGMTPVAGCSVPAVKDTPPQPKPGLSDLLRRKSKNVHADSEFSSGTSCPEPPRQHQTFLTAYERLQRDCKTTDVDKGQFHGQIRSSKNCQAPSRSSYHPVNQDLLFGGEDIENKGCRSGSSGVSKKFVSPLNDGGSNKSNKQTTLIDESESIDPRLKSCDPELIEKIEMEIVDKGDPITFDDIAGLQFAKRCVNELVIWPMARPDIFTGLRTLPKGLLLFGPPGTGKTLIGKAIASQSGATFFNISASSITSKWIGQGEKLVRTLFAVAAVKQPSVIFIDEIDSLLTQRSSKEDEASRRMKTEFLVQLDGAGTKAKDIILVVGATNRPQELDEAARRRFVKRLYIPLPSFEARLDLISRLLKDNENDLTDENKHFVAESTKGYSGADVRALCTEAAMGPIRNCADISTMDATSVRPINLDDFKEALRGVRSSVAAKDLAFYKEWNEEFGSFAFDSYISS